MKKLKNAVFSALNVLVIAGILLFIMAGLVRIGIFEVPDFVKNLLGIADAENGISKGQSASAFLSNEDNADNYEIYTAELTSASVKKILSELKSADVYSHDVQYSVISEKRSLTKRAYVMKRNDVYCAFYLTGDGIVEKQILEKDGITTVNTLSGDSVKSTSYSGNHIDFAAQTGVILTHEDFFKAADEPGYSFKIKSDDVGTVMLIEFTSQNGDYSQLQKYTLSLDYGIVTEAYCYENGELIYELTTNSVSKELTPNFGIPDKLKDSLPDEFAELKSPVLRTAEQETEVSE